MEPFRGSATDISAPAGQKMEMSLRPCPPHSNGAQTDCTNAMSSKDTLDFERCSALHNFVVRHGWTARGHDLSELPNRTYWDRWAPSLAPHQLKDLHQRLHPSVLAFLQRALDLPDFYPGSFQSPVFFYHLVGLSAPVELFANHEDTEVDRFVTLYSLQSSLAADGKLAGGLVYDQVRHRCALIGNLEEGVVFNSEESELPWEPLEAVLMAYCELIETNKVVALPKSVKGPGPFEYVRSPSGGYAMREIPDEELHDPRTGARRTKRCFDPWVMVPITSEDIEAAPVAMCRLVELFDDCTLDHVERRTPRFDCP